jgi:hypothetical protein
MKKVLPLLLIALMFMACGNQNTKKETTEAQTETEIKADIVETDVIDFLNNKEDLVGATVRIKGTVAHVCAHGGKRLFLMHEDTEDRVKVTAGDDIPAFMPEMEGSTVAVIGVVEELKVTPEYLDNWQAEVEAGMGEESEKKIHTGEEGHEHHEGDAEHELGQIENYRSMLAESGKDHLSFFSIDCKEIEVME